jgi:serine protease
MLLQNTRPFDNSPIDSTLAAIQPPIALNTDLTPAPLTSSTDSAGSTLRTARNLGNLTAASSLSEFVGSSDRADIFRFQISGGRSQFTLSELSADADLRLIQDANGDGQIQAAEVLQFSREAGTNSDRILFPYLTDGEYYLEVSAYYGETTYKLDFTIDGIDIGSTIPTAAEIGILTGQKQFTGSIGTNDLSDLYHFRLLNPSDLQLDLNNLSADTDLYLIRDLNGDRQIQSNEYIGRSRLSGTQAERISLDNLTSGDYFVQVWQYGGSSNYTLTLTADSAGETLPSALNLGGFTNTSVNLREFVGTSDRQDMYRLFLNTRSNLEINLQGLSADADLYLVRDLNDNNIAEASEIISSSIKYGSVAESIKFDGLAAGNYFVMVYAYGNTNYSLSVNSATVDSYQILAGTLDADRFTIGRFNESVISGNGNYAYGNNLYDTLDLSNITFSSLSSISLVNAQGNGGTALEIGNGTRLFDTLRLNNGQTIYFEGIDLIQFADRSLNLSVRPNDPLFGEQWNLHMMGVHNAWRFGTGSSEVAVGIIDTGIALNTQGNYHPDLRLTGLTGGLGAIDDFGNVDYNQSHGTAVQSIIAANGNNASGMAGISWNSAVYVGDVLDSGNDQLLSESVAEMIATARSRNQKLIINLSLRYPIDATFETLVAANQDNVLFVVAAGNENVGQLSSPAILAQRYRNVIAVGGVWGQQDRSGTRREPGTRYNLGYDNGSNYGPGLTVMAPTNLLAASSTKLINGTVEHSYSRQYGFGGTSAAAPNVAGVASLVWSANGNLSAAQVTAILSETAYDLGFSGYDQFTGHGFVNADAAVRRALVLTA